MPRPTGARIQDAAPPLDNGRYRLVDVLGQGGMATVYRAWDARLHVWRAIKVLDEKLADRGSLRTRFDNEARTMARLHHRHIVTVHDVGHDGNRVYLVMELIDGGSLAGWVERNGAMPAGLALEVMGEVLGALQIAHDNGVVHRDVKPHNILVDREGKPKVSDFGIARLADTDHSLTRTGAMMGTWTYMAPEQRTSARRVDARADVYAAGATLYALLTAREPYDLYTTELHEELFKGLPEDLIDVIKKATRYKPDDRFPSAQAMRARLGELRGDYPVVTAGTPPLATVGAGGVSAPPPAPLESGVLAAGGRSDPTLHPGATWMGGTAGMQVATSVTALPPMDGPSPTVIPHSEGTLSDEGPVSRPLTAGEATAAEESARRRGLAPWILVVLLVFVVIGLGALVTGLGAALFVDLSPDAALVDETPAPEPTLAPEPVAAPVPEPLPAPAPEPVIATAPAPMPTVPRPAPVQVTPRPAPEVAPVVVRPVPATPTGQLGLSTVPHFSEVFVDGKSYGVTGRPFDVPAGSHQVVLVGSKGGRAELTVDVVAGEKTVVCWDYGGADGAGAPCQR